MADPNIEMLRLAVNRLGKLADELVFVGGCVTGLLITDEGAAEIRPTDDVDAIVEVVSYVEYIKFSEKLQSAGFNVDTREGAPLCRWLKEDTVLDVMPLDESALGFANRWYKPAIETSETRMLFTDSSIKVVSAPYFCATKLEAFFGRGSGDYFASHDIEDIVSVIDGREELVDEIATTAVDLKLYLADKFTGLLKERQFVDALPGHIGVGDAGRVAEVFARLNSIAALS